MICYRYGISLFSTTLNEVSPLHPWISSDEPPATALIIVHLPTPLFPIIVDPFPFVVTVKSNGRLIAKRQMMSNNLQDVEFALTNNTNYYFEASAKREIQNTQINGFWLQLKVGSDYLNVSSVFRSYSPNSAFTVPYRGWSYLIFLFMV